MNNLAARVRPLNPLEAYYEVLQTCTEKYVSKQEAAAKALKSVSLKVCEIK